MLVTPGIAYSYSSEIQGDWVLKTHPVYTKKSIQVLPIQQMADANNFMLENHIAKAVIFSGDSIAILKAK